MDQHLSIAELSDMKRQLQHFSHMPTQQVYRIMSRIYRATITPQQLIKSEITKSFARIALKSLDEDDEKRQKSIKIAKKLLRNWKQMLGYEDGRNNASEPVKKIKTNGGHTPVKVEQTEKMSKQERPAPRPVKLVEAIKAIPQTPTTLPLTQTTLPTPPTQDVRSKATQGLLRYLTKHKHDAKPELAASIEATIYSSQQENEETYKEAIKQVVKRIDQNEDYRNQIFVDNADINKLINQIL